jgi:nitrate/TMAO reductase-like tetraheme cytochrome c subunit
MKPYRGSSGSKSIVIMEGKRRTISFLLLAYLVIGICAGSTPDKEPPEKCGSCHSDSLVFKEWQNSGHATSLRTLLEDKNAGRNCLRCHSADYKRVQLNPWASTSDLPTLKTASNSVSCSACHRHDSGIESNLIMPADKLCTTCHILFCGG